jgi:hypothetical protein
MAFSCLVLLISCVVVVALSSYAVRRIRCCLAVMVVLCRRLNKYYAYLANEVITRVEVRALEVGHGLKTLLPYGVLQILNREKRDR